MRDSSGPILAEWSGDDERVVELLAQVMPGEWRIKTLEGDTLPLSLQRVGALVDLRPSNLQMILNQRPRAGKADLYRLRVLDRI